MLSWNHRIVPVVYKAPVVVVSLLGRYTDNGHTTPASTPTNVKGSRRLLTPPALATLPRPLVPSLAPPPVPSLLLLLLLSDRLQIPTCLATCNEVNSASPVNIATLWSESRRARTTIGESARILHSKAMKPPKQRFDSTQWRGTDNGRSGVIRGLIRVINKSVRESDT